MPVIVPSIYLQLDTFAPDDVLLMVCCYCGSKNTVAAYQTIGHRNMREKRIKSKQPLVKGSLKSNMKELLRI